MSGSNIVSGMRYITYVGETGESVVIFDPIILYTTMAKAMKIKKKDIIGAGKVTILAEANENERVHCYSRSSALGVKSNGSQDAAIIKSMTFSCPIIGM